MRHAAIIAAFGLLLPTSCTRDETQGDTSDFFTGHEVTYLTLNLAQNATELDLLQKLHEGDSSSAISALQFELDARVLFLTEVLSEYGDNPGVKEKRNQIACHLHAIARYRAQHDAQTAYPDIADMATEALKHLPDCKCPEGRGAELASQRRPTSGCS